MCKLSDADKRILHAVTENWKAWIAFSDISQTFFLESERHGLIEKKSIGSTVLWRLTPKGVEMRPKAKKACKGRLGK